MNIIMQQVRSNIGQKWESFLFERDLYNQLGVTDYREARREGDGRGKALVWALHPGPRFGWVLMDVANTVHKAGNRLAGSPYFDTMSEAHADGVKWGRQMDRLGFEART